MVSHDRTKMVVKVVISFSSTLQINQLDNFISLKKFEKKYSTLFSCYYLSSLIKRGRFLIIFWGPTSHNIETLPF